MKNLFLVILLSTFLLALAAPVLANGGDLVLPKPIPCDTAQCLILGILRYLLGLMAIVATFMFIYGGFMWLSSAGNEKRIQQGKETLSWAAIGIVVILLSWALIRYLITVLTNAGSS